MDEQLPKKFRAILDKEDGVIPEAIDLCSLWELIPPEKPYPRNPKYSARLALLRTYVKFSPTKPWARKELRGLLRKLLNNCEPIPALLHGWALHQCAKDAPKSSRGRPEEVDTHLRICVVFVLMRREGYSRTAAFKRIARHVNYEADSVRTIVNRWQSERRLPSPSVPCAENRPAPDEQV